MSEHTSEINPAKNIQRTALAQRKKVEAAGTPLNFVDRFFGTFTRGSVESEFKKGEGGSVATYIESGRASITQDWRFDAAGKLSTVFIRRYLTGVGLIGKEVSTVRLTRQADGKFVVIHRSSSDLLADWAKEFNTANQRMAVRKHK